jgi:hypothetical protein
MVRQDAHLVDRDVEIEGGALGRALVERRVRIVVIVGRRPGSFLARRVLGRERRHAGARGGDAYVRVRARRATFCNPERRTRATTRAKEGMLLCSAWESSATYHIPRPDPRTRNPLPGAMLPTSTSSATTSSAVGPRVRLHLRVWLHPLEALCRLAGTNGPHSGVCIVLHALRVHAQIETCQQPRSRYAADAYEREAQIRPLGSPRDKTPLVIRLAVVIKQRQGCRLGLPGAYVISAGLHALRTARYGQRHQTRRRSLIGSRPCAKETYPQTLDCGRCKESSGDMPGVPAAA